ncbi:hypothetical protein GCM10010297_55990 [Streptomyces malachitofuscus]|nr:hypothetical protein GCM10010297_55990 [Streptomyces malachitofuscus]
MSTLTTLAVTNSPPPWDTVSPEPTSSTATDTLAPSPTDVSFRPVEEPEAEAEPVTDGG